MSRLALAFVVIISLAGNADAAIFRLFRQRQVRVVQQQPQVVIQAGRGVNVQVNRNNVRVDAQRVTAGRRASLLLQAERLGVASRFERRFQDGLSLADEQELIKRIRNR